MSVNRRDIVRHLEEHGFRLIREGGNHSIYGNGAKASDTISESVGSASLHPPYTSIQAPRAA